ncbi:MAG: hypothetical protein ACXADY_08415 [Candidatus Hodarchaeales archaeon]|jgi:hypothetical protein
MMTQDHSYSERPLIHQRIVLLLIDELLGHEEVVSTQVEWLKGNLKKLNYFFRPILVVKNEKVILDGHHRVVALAELGEEIGKKTIRIPCIEIKYLGNSDVTLGTWHPIYREKKAPNFPVEFKKIGIEFKFLDSFSPEVLKDTKYGFTLKTRDNHYALQGTQQRIYKKFLSYYEPETFDYAKTLDYAINSVENGHASFALLRTQVTKQDVLNTAKRKELYAPKTTRHILSFRYQDIKVPLETLLQP